MLKIVFLVLGLVGCSVAAGAQDAMTKCGSLAYQTGQFRQTFLSLQDTLDSSASELDREGRHAEAQALRARSRLTGSDGLSPAAKRTTSAVFMTLAWPPAAYPSAIPQTVAADSVAELVRKSTIRLFNQGAKPMDCKEDERGHDDFRALCMAVGFVVLNWAIIEQQMDNWVNIAFRNCGGSSLKDVDGIPRSFDRKMKFLRKSFKKLPALAPFSTEGLALIERASAISTERNNLVHGGIVSMEMRSGAFQFCKVEYTKDNHAVSTFMFNRTAFSTLETALGDLLTEQLAFSLKLADIFLS
jgi:hypothetical protein